MKILDLFIQYKKSITPHTIEIFREAEMVVDCDLNRLLTTLVNYTGTAPLTSATTPSRSTPLA